MKKMIFVTILLFISSLLFATSYYDFVDQKCKELGIPTDIVISIIEVESNWRNIKGITGDIGFMQLNPLYISYYEQKFWKYQQSFDPWNPYHNLEVGINYIYWLYCYFKDWELTIKAYNIGINRVKENRFVGERYYFKVVRTLSSL
jgi:soluble lytic murein transglycosylase-like protein